MSHLFIAVIAPLTDVFGTGRPAIGRELLFIDESIFCPRLDSVGWVFDRLFPCSRDWRNGHGDQRQRMVPNVIQAPMESARVDLWAGVDDALHCDERGSVAGVATSIAGWKPYRHRAVLCAARAQCSLVGALLWPAAT